MIAFISLASSIEKIYLTVFAPKHNVLVQVLLLNNNIFDGLAASSKHVYVSIADTQLSFQQEISLLEQAEKLLKLKQIMPARQLLEYLASHGSAKGAYLLAQTYDDDYLIPLHIVGGIKGNRTLALQWYTRARELGSQEAAQNIQRLK